MCDYNTLLALYQYADSQNIDVYYYAMRQVKSMVLPDETIVMNTDKIETGTEETVHLAHELEHIETGSFYSIHSEFDLRAKHELRADRRAIKRHPFRPTARSRQRRHMRFMGACRALLGNGRFSCKKLSNTTN